MDSDPALPLQIGVYSGDRRIETGVNRRASDPTTGSAMDPTRLQTPATCSIHGPGRSWRFAVLLGSIRASWCSPSAEPELASVLITTNRSCVMRRRWIGAEDPRWGHRFRWGSMISLHSPPHAARDHSTIRLHHRATLRRIAK